MHLSKDAFNILLNKYLNLNLQKEKYYDFFFVFIWQKSVCDKLVIFSGFAFIGCDELIAQIKSK